VQLGADDQLLTFVDFAGQRVYLSGHVLFLSDKHVYLNIFSYKNAASKCFYGDILYWMRVLKAYACGAPIIHVGTNRDCMSAEERTAVNLEIIQRCQQQQIDGLRTV
jgi:hypothetical protein